MAPFTRRLRDYATEPAAGTFTGPGLSLRLCRRES